MKNFPPKLLWSIEKDPGCTSAITTTFGGPGRGVRYRKAEIADEKNGTNPDGSEGGRHPVLQCFQVAEEGEAERKGVISTSEALRFSRTDENFPVLLPYCTPPFSLSYTSGPTRNWVNRILTSHTAQGTPKIP